MPAKFPVPEVPTELRIVAGKEYYLRELTLKDLIEVEAQLLPATLATAATKAATLMFCLSAGISFEEAASLPLSAMGELTEVISGFRPGAE
jgi:hypothetical protein